MIEFTKKPHTAIICGNSNEKEIFIINLLNNEYLNYFDIVVISNQILLPLNPSFIYSDDFEEIQIKYKGKKILFIVDSNITFIGSHTNSSFWILTQKYNCVDEEVRSQSSWVCSFYSKNINSFNNMIDENYTGDLNVDEAFKFLRDGKRRKLFLKTDFPIQSFLSE